jgi:hypothetical protein
MTKSLLFIATLFSMSVYAQVPTNGLVAYYPFNGNSIDESKNGNNGTVYNATLITDRYGNSNSSYSFNGTSSYISVNPNPNLNLKDSLSISIWTKIDFINSPSGKGHHLIDKGSNSTNEYSLTVNQSDRKVCFNKQGIQIIASSNTPLPDKKWTHILVTYKYPTAKIYINGILDITGTISSPFTSSNSFLCLGSLNNTPDVSTVVNGSIDDISVYNRVLTNTEIQQLYTACYTNCIPVCIPRLTANGLYENFTRTTSSNSDKSGIYFFGKNYNTQPNPNFSAYLTRDTVKQMLNVSVTQAQGEYVPFGTSLGDTKGDGTGKPYYMDLSSNSKFSITVKNTSTTPIKFKIYIQDSTGQFLDTYYNIPSPENAGNGGLNYITDPNFSNAYKYQFETPINAGSSVTYSGDFSNGAFADYKLGKWVTGFNFSKVANIYYIVTNQNNTGSPIYSPLALSNVPISISNLQIGPCNSQMFVAGTIVGYPWWTPVNTPMTLISGNTWQTKGVQFSAGSDSLKFLNDPNWKGIDWGKSTGTSGIAKLSNEPYKNISFNIPTTGKYTITFNDRTLAYSIYPDGLVTTIEEEKSKDSYIQLYPNPTDHNFTINNTENLQIRSIRITNLLGQEKMYGKPESTSSNINVDMIDIPSGIYFITIEHNKGIESFKIIKN